MTVLYLAYARSRPEKLPWQLKNPKIRKSVLFNVRIVGQAWSTWRIPNFSENLNIYYNSVLFNSAEHLGRMST